MGKSLFQKIELYLISLAPLFGLLFVNTVKVPRCWGEGCSFVGWGELFKINVIPSIFLVLIASVVMMYVRFNYEAKGATQLAKRIKEVENIQFENLSFFATYMIPLVAFDLTRMRGVVMLALVLTFMGAIFVKTRTFYLNPALSVLGYWNYRITTTKGEKIIVISRSKLAVDDWIRPRLIDDKIYFAAKTYEQGTDS